MLLCASFPPGILAVTYSKRNVPLQNHQVIRIPEAGGADLQKAQEKQRRLGLPLTGRVVLVRKHRAKAQRHFISDRAESPPRSVQSSIAASFFL